MCKGTESSAFFKEKAAQANIKTSFGSQKSTHFLNAAFWFGSYGNRIEPSCGPMFSSLTTLAALGNLSKMKTALVVLIMVVLGATAVTCEQSTHAISLVWILHPEIFMFCFMRTYFAFLFNVKATKLRLFKAAYIENSNTRTIDPISNVRSAH